MSSKQQLPVFLLYAASAGFIGVVIIVLIIALSATEKNEQKDFDKYESMYASIVARASDLSTTSAAAAEVSSLYEDWLTNISSRVTWRAIVIVSVIVAAIITGLVFILIPLLPWHVATSAFMFLTTLLIVFVIMGLHQMFIYHVVRPCSNYSSIYRLSKL